MGRPVPPHHRRGVPRSGASLRDPVCTRRHQPFRPCCWIRGKRGTHSGPGQLHPRSPIRAAALPRSWPRRTGALKHHGFVSAIGFPHFGSVVPNAGEQKPSAETSIFQFNGPDLVRDARRQERAAEFRRVPDLAVLDLDQPRSLDSPTDSCTSMMIRGRMRESSPRANRRTVSAEVPTQCPISRSRTYCSSGIAAVRTSW